MKRFFKNLIRSILIVAVCSVLFSAAMLVPYREPETADPQIVNSTDASYFKQEIYLDGRHINNWTLADPVLSACGTVYVPLCTDGLEDENEVAARAARQTLPVPEEQAVGTASGNRITVEPEAEKQEESPSPEESSTQEESRKTGEGSEGWEERFSAVYPVLDAVRVDHSFKGMSGTYGFKDLKGWTLDDSSDIFLSDLGVYYGSLSFLKNSLGIDACYREGKGLYLSTDPAVSAEAWADRDTNPSYIEGMTKFIMSVNRNLTEEEAAEIEFLIRHVAAQHKYMKPDLIAGIIMVESRFRPYITNSIGATGLMQALIKYARIRGYTESMLLDPHINIEYGTSFMESLIASYRGDVTAGLAAYNMGAAYVTSGGDYNKAYPNAVYDRMSEIKSWLSRNGYSTEFKEQL